MIRLKRYLVALTSLVLVLLVGHFYVNKISSLSSSEFNQNDEIPQINRIHRVLEKWTNSSPSNSYNITKKTSFPHENAQTTKTSIKSEIHSTFPNRYENKVISTTKPAQFVGHVPSVGNVRPYMVDPVKYALRMAKIRLLIEVYGPQVVRGARQKSNGDLVLPPVGIPHQQVILVSYWRSGSSFLGDLLNHYPATFYHFEPLHSLTFNRLVSSEAERAEAVRLLSHLMRCEFEDLEQYLLWSRQSGHQFLFTHNHRLWTACRIRTSMCFEPSFLSSLCSDHPIQLSKVVRLPLAATETLLRENPRLKVVYLLRDPRGIFSSRLNLDWCNESAECIRPDIACASIRRDLEAAKDLKAEFPGRFIALRYEDLAFHPEKQTEELFRFLEFDMTRQIKTFLQANTKARGKSDNTNPYSTRRDSRSTALKWRQKLSFEQVRQIQNSCSDVIIEAGFELISNEQELRGNSSWVT